METNEYIWRDAKGQVITHCYGISDREMSFVSMGVHFGLLSAGRRNGRINVYLVTPEGEKLAHSIRLTPKK